MLAAVHSWLELNLCQLWHEFNPRASAKAIYSYAQSLPLHQQDHHLLALVHSVLVFFISIAYFQYVVTHLSYVFNAWYYLV
jgi:hypothetical protein